MELIKATLNDAEILWEMQKIAFSELYEKYQDHDTSPANEPLKKMIERLEQDFTYYYFIVSSGDKVGAVRVVDMKNDSPKRVSPIFIMPEFRRKGYARTAMLEAEKLHGEENWELETILEEDGNCRLYESLGYRKTGKYVKINDIMTLVYYRK